MIMLISFNNTIALILGAALITSCGNNEPGPAKCYPVKVTMPNAGYSDICNNCI